MFNRKLEQKVDDLDSHIARLSANYYAFQSEMLKQQETISELATKLHNYIKTNEPFHKQLETTLKDTEERLNALETIANDYDKYSSLVSALDVRTNSAKNKMEYLEKQVNELQSKIRLMNPKIDKLDVAYGEALKERYEILANHNIIKKHHEELMQSGSKNHAVILKNFKENLMLYQSQIDVGTARIKTLESKVRELERKLMTGEEKKHNATKALKPANTAIERQPRSDKGKKRSAYKTKEAPALKVVNQTSKKG